MFARKTARPPLNAALVVGVLVGVALVAVAYPRATPASNPGGCLCAPTFSIGNPVGPTECRVPLAPGCVSSGEFVYDVTVLGNTVPLGAALYRVADASGANVTDPSEAGFAYVTSHGTVLASYVVPAGAPLAMNSTAQWTFANGATATTPTGDVTLVVDVGAVDPSGMGWSIYARTTGAGPDSSASTVLP